MIEMVLFHHHSSIYNEDWSKPGFGRVCSNPRYIYYFRKILQKYTVVSHIYTYDRAQNILNFVQPLQNLIL